jgi:hypothetical protein
LIAKSRSGLPCVLAGVWQHGHVTMGVPGHEFRLAAEEYLAASPDAFGDIDGQARPVRRRRDTRALILDDPLRLTVTFEEFQRP